MKILVVMGTRPEAIKLAPVVAALRRHKGLKTYVCATAQHRELLDQALRLFSLKPNFDLNLMRRGQSPNAVARRTCAALAPLLSRLKPDLVVVQGDTTTAAAAALTARERGIPVAHIEAGLRSFDLKNPYPEELNRVFIDLCSTLLFAPTVQARRNLHHEKISGRTVIMTGNTVVDALRTVDRGWKMTANRGVREVLVTLHRREIHGAPFRRICAALIRLVEKHPDLTFVYTLHPNPLLLNAAKRLLRHPRIKLLSPQPYPTFIGLMKRSLFIITDSGGLQEEAVCLGKPLLIVREKTERPEVLSHGTGRLVGLSPRRLELWTTRLLTDSVLRRTMSRKRDLYGDGRASQRIAAGIAHWFGLGRKPEDWKP